MKKRRIAILGSTGSIGTQALDVIRQHPDVFEVELLTANNSSELLIKQALFAHEGDEMVIVKDIEFYSLCEHHVLPFYGTISIGYIPNGEIVGLSKLARVVETFARRLQVQERLTSQVCQAVAQNIKNKGVIVVCNAAHMCMKMRGIEKQATTTATMQYCGEFEKVELQNQFFNLLNTKKEL